MRAWIVYLAQDFYTADNAKLAWSRFFFLIVKIAVIALAV